MCTDLITTLHPIIQASDLMPFVVFVAPPSLERLRRWKMERSEPVASDDELKEIIERAREMEEAYGHYFDMVSQMRVDILIEINTKCKLIP